MRRARSARKRAKPVIHLSQGPLPLKFDAQYRDHVCVFSDASNKTQGGLAAVLFGTPDSVPVVATLGVPLVGSNEQELHAALFAMRLAGALFPGRPLALFTDNQDAATRLLRAQASGPAGDPGLGRIVPELDLAAILPHVSIRWIKGHSTCRGNALADQYARTAARIPVPGLRVWPGESTEILGKPVDNALTSHPGA